MSALLYIPWFKAEPLKIPLPFEIPIFGDHLPIQPFGVLVAIGVLLGAEVAKAYGKRRDISPDVLADFITHVVVAGFVGAMILNVALYRPARLADMFGGMEAAGFSPVGGLVGLGIGLFLWWTYSYAERRVLDRPVLVALGIYGVLGGVLGWMMPELLENLEWPGLSSYGGFIGAVVGLILWRVRRGIPTLPLADVVVFALPFGWMFGRTGCFVVHDHPGKVTDFALAVDFDPDPEHVALRHDLGLYEVFWSIGCIAILLLLARKERRVGFYAALVPLLYGPIRFFLDYLRAAPEQGGDVRYLGLTPAQYASIGFVLFGIALMYRIYNKPAPELPPEARYSTQQSGSEPEQTKPKTQSSSSKVRSTGKSRSGQGRKSAKRS